MHWAGHVLFSPFSHLKMQFSDETEIVNDCSRIYSVKYVFRCYPSIHRKVAYQDFRCLNRYFKLVSLFQIAGFLISHWKGIGSSHDNSIMFCQCGFPYLKYNTTWLCFSYIPHFLKFLKFSEGWQRVYGHRKVQVKVFTLMPVQSLYKACLHWENAYMTT
jgi:hypothetical protein